MKRFFSPASIASAEIIGVIRIVIGLLLIYHGHEVFRPEIMEEYFKWENFQGTLATVMVYAGKTSELIGGILILLGLLTRVGAVLVIGTFLYITFRVGSGRFWYEDQHPFMFALFGVLFFFVGPGAWSVDARIFANGAKTEGRA